MTDQNRKPKDISDLFLKFGGDPHDYQEFKPAISASQGINDWPALSGAESPPTLPQQNQLPQAVQPQVAAVAQGLPADCHMPRELDIVFARIAGELAAPAVAAQGRLSQWRRRV